MHAHTSHTLLLHSFFTPSLLLPSLSLRRRWKYDYLQGYRRSPWHRGIIGNLMEVFTLPIDWTAVYHTPDQLQSATLASVRATDPGDRSKGN